MRSRRMAALLLGSSIFLVSCSAGQPRPAIPGTPTTSNESSLPCLTMPGHNAASSPVPSPGKTAPPYSEVHDKVSTTNAKLQEAINAGDGNAPEEIRNDFTDYWSQLQGKSISQWNAWVVAIGSETDDYLNSNGDQNVENLAKSSDIVLLSLEDPFQPSTDSAITRTSSLVPGMFSEPWALVRPDSASIGSICVGQAVLFSGNVSGALADYSSSIGLVVPDARVIPGKRKVGDTSGPPKFPGLVISLDRSVCFGACPAYRVTAYDEGTVVFWGGAFTTVVGFRIWSVSQSTLQQLVTAFNDGGYFSLSDYTHEDWTDNPSASTSITLQGRTHSVAHYYGDNSAPQKLFDLEDSVDKLLNTEEWVYPKTSQEQTAVPTP